MHCNGKCHLKKQLQKEDKKENAPSGNLKNKSELQFFSESRPVIISAELHSSSKLNIHYLLGMYHTDPHSIFHPPRA